MIYRKTSNVFLFVVILLQFVICYSCSNYDEEKNKAYLDNTLAPMVLEYYNDFDKLLPEHFDIVVDYHYRVKGYSRRNRGDYYGCGLGYYKIDEYTFLFHSRGPLDVTTDDILTIYRIKGNKMNKIERYHNDGLVTYLLAHNLY